MNAIVANTAGERNPASPSNNLDVDQSDGSAKTSFATSELRSGTHRPLVRSTHTSGISMNNPNSVF